MEVALLVVFPLISLIGFLIFCFILRWVLGTSHMINRLSAIEKHTEKQSETIETITTNLQKLTINQKDTNILISAMEGHLRKIADKS